MYRDHKRARRDPNPRPAAERAEPAQRCTGLRSPHEQQRNRYRQPLPQRSPFARDGTPPRIDLHVPGPAPHAAPPDSRTGLRASGTARSRCPARTARRAAGAGRIRHPGPGRRALLPGYWTGLPGGLHIPRQLCGRCPQDRRSSPVSGLNGPLGRTLAPNDDLIAVNGSTAARSGSLPAAGRPRRGAWSVAAPVPCSASRRRPAGMACCSSTAASAPWTCPALTPAMARPPGGAAGPGQR